MILFYIIASKFRNKKDKLGWTSHAINVSVYLVVTLMGLRMGSNEEVTSSLGTIGVQSLIATSFVIAGSFIFVTITRKILRIDRYAHRHEKGEISKEQLKEKRANSKIEVDSENLRMTVIIIVILVITMIVGYFWIPKVFGSGAIFAEKTEICMSVGIALLLVSVGFSLGLDGTVLSRFKTAGITVLIFPLVNVIGSTLFGALYGLIAPVTVKEGMCIALGFGWYTFAPSIIQEAGFAVGGAICFLTNVIRETLGIIFIPLVAQILGNLEATVLPGVAAMDICLPIVERSCSEETVVYSFATGAVCCLATATLVPIIIAL